MKKDQEFEVCEACGVSGQIGYVIGEGDNVAEVTILGNNRQEVVAEFNAYLKLAQEINANVRHDLDLTKEFAIDPLKIKMQFECSAEKLIFELRSRSIATHH
ncbi:MAG: DUF406 family protein [Enterovibrio sp.]